MGFVGNWNQTRFERIDAEWRVFFINARSVRVVNLPLEGEGTHSLSSRKNEALH